MQVIDRLEAEPRGAYTGSIGFVGPGETGGGEAALFVDAHQQIDDAGAQRRGHAVAADGPARADADSVHG
jgi:anthranilate/para-aminobenzoate synthase component I